MSLRHKLTMLTLVSLLVLAPVTLVADNAVSPDTDLENSLKTRSPKSSAVTGDGYIRESDLPGARGVLWSQIPADTTSAAGYACQLDSVYPFDADICDDVTPGGTGWSIDSITTWWANWNGFNDWSYVPNIHVLVYRDSTAISPHPVDSEMIDIIVPQSNYTASGPFGTNSWRVDLELPTPIELPPGEIWWIEVQPANDFSVNGQTGWQAEAGIGNGNELWFRFPAIGTPEWTDATTQWGEALETAMVLRGGSLSDTVRWDFETGWQDWIHTNGLAFPSAWDVQPCSLHASYTPPNPGDSTFWIDSDAAGSGGPWVQDTCLSPQIIPDASNTNWLWYGFGFNDCGTPDFYEVGLKYYDGSSWTLVPLKTYDGVDTVGADSIDISSYNTYERLQVYFYYDDGNAWSWYASFDNVTINGEIYVASHDVGATSIDNPGDVVEPNLTITPTATFENFGNNTETFEAHYEIDTAGVNIYSEMATIDLDPGMDTTYQFPDHTTLGEGTAYDITAYTVLGGDMDPSNDTTTQATLVTAKYWENLTDLPKGSSSHSMATLDDGFIYIFHMAGSYATSDTVAVYDITNETWSIDTINPYGPAGYGWAGGVNGAIYRIGGTNSWPTGLTRVDIYDPAGGTFSSGSTAPAGLIDFSAGVYNDSLIYTFGGGNWSATPISAVYMYDTYNDAWTTSSSLPDARGCTGGGVIDTFAIVACGYTSGGTYGDDYVVGIIDSSDPTTISWGSYGAIPGITEGKYRVPSGVDKWNKEFYIVGGQGSSGTSDQCLAYDPYTDTWVEEMPKNNAFANVSHLSVTEDTRGGEVGVYAAGGYDGGVYLTNTEMYHTADTTPQGIEDGGQENLEFGLLNVDQLAEPGYAAITYTTSINGPTTLKIYDLMGRNVRTLVDRVKEAPGRRTAYWNYKDNNNNTVVNGVYFLRLESDSRVATQKMILVR